MVVQAIKKAALRRHRDRVVVQAIKKAAVKKAALKKAALKKAAVKKAALKKAALRRHTLGHQQSLRLTSETSQIR